VPASRFSIIITCHNQAKFIRDAVNSAMTQIHRAREIIIVDDASTDESAEMLKLFRNSTRLVTLPKNIGANAARNLGASHADGDYLVFLDGDDLLLPWALNTYETIASTREAKTILSRLLFFEGILPPASGQIPSEINFVEYENLIQKDRTHRASASATVVERATFQKVGGWTDGLFHLDDLDIMMKLGVSGRCIQILSPATICYRVHARNTVNQVAPFIPAMRTLISKEKSGEYPGGARFRFARYAFLGGPIIFWLKRCIRARLFGSASSLVIHGWLMAMAAVTRRLFCIVAGRRKYQTLHM
jgi:glycosyltransferase involved in cell wall biosynthesis